ncbi:acyl-CoA dehydrogenase family protein [Nocardia salmonicida]|uniref:acyl-CoA dehydrogenase family protein n=1 Tax=Nocardia salmonicida TaxID=53431 RepID=UPI0033D9DF45
MFSEEQDELRGMLRDFFSRKSPTDEVRRLMDSDLGYDPVLWKQMGEELGLQGIAIPEEFGGSGYSFAEVLIVLEEMGRRLVCAPYFSTVVLAAHAILCSGDDAAKRRYLPRIADGSLVSTVALTEPDGRWDQAGICATATDSGAGWTISGVKSYVLDGYVADLVLVAARGERGVSLFAVPGDAPGLTKSLLSTLDQTRKQAQLKFSNTPATLVGAEGQGWAILEQVLDFAAIGLATEQVGGAQSVLDMSVQFAKERIQYGRPIGSFQAIKHKCADMLLQLESARSAAYFASWCAGALSDDLSRVAAVAKATCSDAYVNVATENIQIHGGVGFTWEHPAHLYFRRAKSSELLFGDPDYWRELFLQRTGI